MKEQKSILGKFIQALSEFSGLHMCVYDLAYFTRDDEKLNIPSTLREHCSPLCQKVKSSKSGWDCCIRDEYYRASQSQKKNAPFMHTCHAGLTDLVVPIRRGGKQIGAIYVGQAVTIGEEKQEVYISTLSGKFKFSKSELRSLFKLQPHVDKGRLREAKDILNGLRDYIELSEMLLEIRKKSFGGSNIPNQVRIEMGEVPTFFLDQLHPQSNQIRKALDILKNRYWQKLTLTNVAREVGFSESHFTREFRRETGFSFRKCVVESRINAALYLLKRSHLNVGEVAEMVGYEDISSMGRAFRKQVGASPRQFLRMQPPPWLIDDIAKTHFSSEQKMPK